MMASRPVRGDVEALALYANSGFQAARPRGPPVTLEGAALTTACAGHWGH